MSSPHAQTETAGLRILGHALHRRDYAIQLVSALGDHGRHYFVDSEQARVYQAIEGLVREGAEVIDLVTVGDAYGMDSDLEFLTSCFEQGFSGGDPQRDLRSLIEGRQWNRLRAMLGQLGQAAADPEFRERIGIQTPNDVMRAFCEDFQALVAESARIGKRAVRASEMRYRAEQYMATIERGEPTGWEWGIPVLDDAFRLEMGGLYTVGAPSKSAKTKLAVWVGHRMAEYEQMEVYHQTLEMPREQTWDWYVSRHLGINSNWIGREDMPRHVVEKLLEESHPIYNLHLTIDDTPEISVGDLDMKVREWKMTTVGARPALLIVDFVQLMQEYMTAQDNIAAASKRIAYGLHQIAQREQIAVLAVAQLNREADSAPQTSARFLEGGGGWKQASRAVVILDNILNRKPRNGVKAPYEATPIQFELTQRGAPSWRGKMCVDLTTGYWRECRQAETDLLDRYWGKG